MVFGIWQVCRGLQSVCFSSSLEDIRKIAGGGDRLAAFCQVAGVPDDLCPELGDIAPAFFRSQDGHGGGRQIEAVEQ